ncbi:MAG: response regulator [Candidatus Sulfotelmatobacter sp.]|jgi:CheY-like chemotaxis protein
MAALRLLVVEDDAASLELMEEVFSSLKADVHGVGESSNAAELVNRERFDGIFLDLEMPSMNGFDLARWIRNSSWNRSTPIVIVTGRDDRQTMQEVFSSGATFYLQKPVDRQKLTNLYRTVRGALFECRRRFLRVPLQTDVMCTVGSRQARGMTWNLSQGGMQVEAENLQPGQQVRVSFRLPSSGTAIDATGIVVWVAEKRQGIRFEQVKNPQAIRDFISEIDGMDGVGA